MTIKPCPFCGTEAVHRETIEHYTDPVGSFSCRHSVACDECGIEISEEHAEDALATWNRRAEIAP
jgi:Lar family restriction alleviation protein